jgi:hypothetical protein
MTNEAEHQVEFDTSQTLEIPGMNFSTGMMIAVFMTGLLLLFGGWFILGAAALILEFIIGIISLLQTVCAPAARYEPPSPTSPSNRRFASGKTGGLFAAPQKARYLNSLGAFKSREPNLCPPEAGLGGSCLLPAHFARCANLAAPAPRKTEIPAHHGHPQTKLITS